MSLRYARDLSNDSLTEFIIIYGKLHTPYIPDTQYQDGSRMNWVWLS